MTNLDKIKDFLRSVGADVMKLDESGKYNGSLYMDGCTSLTEVHFPEGMIIDGYLSMEKCTSLTEVYFSEGMIINGDLYMGKCTSLTKVHFSEGMFIDGDLSMSGCTSLTEVHFPEGMIIDGDLSMDGCTSLKVVHFPEGMIIVGHLFMSGCTSLMKVHFSEGMTITGSRFLGNHKISGITGAPKHVDAPTVFHWRWRDRQYIKADGIFMRVISHRGSVYKVARIGKDEETYLVTDGGGKWAHGDTLEEARADLLYKIGSRDTSRYKGLTLDSELTHEEAIEAYRIITGACSAGTRHFCENILPPERKKEKYTIREIIELTAGNYGAERFREFFER